jgi:ATP-dependent exoDNAse (exonuclease V) beta subunit
MDDGSKEVHNFNFLMNYYKIKPVKNEVPIILMVDNQPVIAGRLDLVLQENDTLSLADIKTTSQLDKEYLAYQLNLYRLGYMQSYGERIDKLYGLHLRGDKRKLVELPINEDIALELLEKYERSKNNE